MKPNTGIEVIQEYVCDADMVLVMTVEPGYGGQSFMPDMMSKVRRVRQMAPHLDIQVDGGVGPKTIDTCSDVSCSIFKHLIFLLKLTRKLSQPFPFCWYDFVLKA